MPLVDVNFANTVELLIKGLGLKVAVLGGCPRDVAHGIESNDIDLCVFGDKATQPLIDLIYDLVEPYIEKEYLDIEGADYGDPNITNVLKLVGSVDVIFWNPKFETAKEVVACFDCNLNQWELTDFGPVFIGTGEGTYQQLCAVDSDRETRMRDYAKSIGWTA